MGTPRKEAQHARCIGFIAGFFQYVLIADHGGVRSQHKICRILRGYRAGFLGGEPHRILRRIFPIHAFFGHVCRFHPKHDARLTQQL